MVYPVLAITQEVLDFVNLQKGEIGTRRNIIQALYDAFTETARFINNTPLEERYGLDVNKESKKLFNVWSKVLEVIKPLDVNLASSLEKQIVNWICPGQLLLTIKMMKTLPRRRFKDSIMMSKMHSQLIQVRKSI